MENLDNKTIQELYNTNPSFRKGYRTAVSEFKKIIAERIKNDGDDTGVLSSLSSELTDLRFRRTSEAAYKQGI